LDPGHAEARRNLAVLHAERRARQAAVDAALGGGGPGLEALYEEACRAPSDIHEHLPTLRRLASGLCHVTEMGTRTAVSTTALLAARPAKLVCYDKVRLPQAERLFRQAEGTRVEFRQEDVLAADIEETDLLFIDTWHVYGQLRAELARHAGRVRRYLVLHDTTTFGAAGETAGHRGLWPAVEEFLAEGAFRLAEKYENNNGLTVLERVRPQPRP
jgi:hypothetical protein